MSDPKDTRAAAEVVRRDVTAYARLAARLSCTEGRDALLAAHGLDEDRWEELEDVWQERMSAEEEATAGNDGVPLLTRRFAEAFAEASGDELILPFDRYVAITRELRHGVDLKDVLPRVGVSLATYLEAHRTYTRRMIEEPALADELQRALAL